MSNKQLQRENGITLWYRDYTIHRQTRSHGTEGWKDASEDSEWMIVQCGTFSKSLNPRNIDKGVIDKGISGSVSGFRLKAVFGYPYPVANSLSHRTGPTLASAGPNARPRRGPLWAMVLLRHRAQSTVLWSFRWRYFRKITIWILKKTAIYWSWSVCSLHDNIGVPNLRYICLSEGIHLRLGIQGKHIIIRYFFKYSRI